MRSGIRAAALTASPRARARAIRAGRCRDCACADAHGGRRAADAQRRRLAEDLARRTYVGPGDRAGAALVRAEPRAGTRGDDGLPRADRRARPQRAGRHRGRHDVARPARRWRPGETLPGGRQARARERRGPAEGVRAAGGAGLPAGDGRPTRARTALHRRGPRQHGAGGIVARRSRGGSSPAGISQQGHLVRPPNVAPRATSSRQAGRSSLDGRRRDRRYPLPAHTAGRTGRACLPAADAPRVDGMGAGISRAADAAVGDLPSRAARGQVAHAASPSREAFRRRCATRSAPRICRPRCSPSSRSWRYSSPRSASRLSRVGSRVTPGRSASGWRSAPTGSVIWLVLRQMTVPRCRHRARTRRFASLGGRLIASQHGVRTGTAVALAAVVVGVAALLAARGCASAAPRRRSPWRSGWPACTQTCHICDGLRLIQLFELPHLGTDSSGPRGDGVLSATSSTRRRSARSRPAAAAATPAVWAGPAPRFSPLRRAIDQAESTPSA